MTPRVSVIIPTYNRAATIERAIDSVFAQNVPIELIVVDDGSKDDTADIVTRRYGDRVRLIRQPNQGSAAARNQGIRAAGGELIAFLDSDDEWLPGKLAAQIAILDAHPEVALTSGQAQYFDEQGRAFTMSNPSCSGWILERLLLTNMIITSSVLVRRGALLEHSELFRKEQQPAEDWGLWLRVASRHQVIVAPDVIVRYHVTADGLTRLAPLDSYYRIFDAIYRTMHLDPELERAVKRNRRKMDAMMHMMTALLQYNAGNGGQARLEALKAVLRSPSRTHWKPLIRILFLPRAVTEWLRRRKGRTA